MADITETDMRPVTLTFVIYGVGYNRLQRKSELSLLWPFQEHLEAEPEGIEVYALWLTSVTETGCNTMKQNRTLSRLIHYNF